MQLTRKRRRRLRQTLCLSTCALLGTTFNARADRGDWTINTSALYYTEAGGVSVFEPVVYAKQDLGNQAYLNLNFTGDILTGATPTGAMPSSQSQLITGPSGRLQIASQPGDTPKNPNFSDVRGAFSTTWSQPFDENWRMDLGGRVSLETDFESLGGNFGLSRDFNEKNTTLTGGISFEFDNVNPIGGVPQPLGQIPTNGSTLSVTSKRSKTVKDALFGITQVMNRYWLAQVNLSYGDYNGYLNDPYKQVSIIESQTGATQPQGEPLYQIYENRPPKRLERSVFVRNKIYIAGNVLDVSYNHGWDTWHVLSNMYEVRYRWSLGNGYFIQPHLRYYRQSAAYFYRRGLLNSETVPAYVSADYRLSALTSHTIGLEFGMPFRGDYSLPPGVLTFRLEHYTQSGGSDPTVNIGIQQNYSLFPGLSAYFAQVDYSVSF